MKAATHDGTFHADDVFAAAVLRRIFPNIEIKRTRDPGEIERADIVFDVGGIYNPKTLRFDHHQKGSPVRENGIAYSSFGLVWKEFGERYCDSKAVADQIDSILVQPVDASDNGQAISMTTDYKIWPFSVEDVIVGFNPSTFGSDELGMEGQLFCEAIGLAERILDRLAVKTKEKLDTLDYIESQSLESPDERYVVLESAVPLNGLRIPNKRLLYTLSPRSNSVDSGWGVRAILEDEGEYVYRKLLPAEWAGLHSKELVQVSGVADAIFCHKHRFLAGTKTREGAIRLAQKALAEEE